MAQWNDFFDAKTKQIFEEKKEIIDIGGGLRISRDKSNRADDRKQWVIPYLSKVNYRIMDPVPDYNPDVVGDIHHMPFADQSIDAVICIAVLEHVEDPLRACADVYRILKKGGYFLTYIPFLFYYHAEKTYYKDYWRFTKDSIPLLLKDFAEVEVCPVRGALETWLHISPLGKIKFLVKVFRYLDTISKKNKSNQISGYFIFAKK